ncbi:MAG: heme exporter protein CcmD [Hyphomicrobiales bacterium]|nr:heme exporter protein CcmD [Hyphomicrobiales bacterium]MCY4048613.1 heme exporter protein CcmD [Hyphomicrobiales bacterium]MCY4052588.1 heme exporter protein CcmD [Hyphomicrobiales bacterium]
MGKYAVFIWSSYGVSCAVLAGLVIATIAQLYRQRRLLRRLESGSIERP